MPRAVATRSDVLVIGAGRAGRAAARAAEEAGAAVTLVDKRDGVFAVDLVVRDGAFAAAVLLEGGAFRVARAGACVLATGGVDGLFVPSPATGDGLAIAARAGAALTDLHLFEERETPPRLLGGVRVADGLTSIERLFAAGGVARATGATAEEEGRLAGEAAASARGSSPAPGRVAARPAIDEPLPPGFADAKFARLRDTMTRHLGEPAKAIPLVLRLKGEADDFARARPDPDLYALQNACEAAMLILKARRG